MPRAPSPVASISSYTPRLQSAFVRADESAQRLRRVAEALSEEIDDVTPVHGVQISDFPEEDSMVIAVERVIETHDQQKTAAAERRPGTKR